MNLYRTLPLIAAMSSAFTGAASGQSLVELYDIAKGYDANFKSVQIQAQATRLKSSKHKPNWAPPLL